MSTLFDTIERATAAGILPVQANETLQEKDSNQPWPAVLLGFIGAQFAVWPILAFIVFSGVGEFIYKGPGSYVVSAIFLVGSLVVLRTTKATGFMGHLAFTALIIGDFLWLFSLTRDLEGNAPLLMMFLVTVSQIALAFLVPDNWTKALLGAASCVAFIITYAIFSKYDEHSARSIWWFISSMTAAALWAALVITEPRWAGRRFAATLSSLATGWGFAVLVAAALGSSEFFARSWSYLGAGASTSSVSFVYTLTANLPFLLTAASGAALLWLWRASLATSGRWLLVLAFVALTALAWFVPNVAAVAIALAAALLTQRHRMAAFAVLVLLYLLGQFYYSLSMTLVDKATPFIVTHATSTSTRQLTPTWKTYSSVSLQRLPLGGFASAKRVVTYVPSTQKSIASVIFTAVDCPGERDVMGTLPRTLVVTLLRVTSAVVIFITLVPTFAKLYV